MKQWIKIDNFQDLSSKKYSVISLFSGCGGKDLGMLGGFSIFGKYYGRNNFEVVYANDIEKYACKTYNVNFKHKAECANIYDLDVEKLPKADIVVGGFPCQDFSVAGKRRGFINTERGLLYLEMKRVIDHVKPLVFVAENVEGLLNLNGSATIERIKSDFESSNYHVEYQVFNAADYDVPQIRKRVIIIGFRKDIFKDLVVPYPSPVRNQQINPIWMTAKEAIDDLWLELDKNTFANHSSKDYSKAKFYEGKKMQGNCRIRADRPAPTIRSEHHGNIEGHYRTFNESDSLSASNWRRLSIRECARIQTFPDTFFFRYLLHWHIK